MSDTERMAVELTVFVDVPADITEDGMDRAADGVVQTIGADYDVALNRPPALVDYIGGRRTQDAVTRYQEEREA